MIASSYALFMLNYARQRVRDVLQIPRMAVLATGGPAGVQAGEFPCEAVGLSLYLLVPKTSDHLFNLEQNSAVTVLTREWELKGDVQVILPDAPGLNLDLIRESGPYANWLDWSVLVRVEPYQVQIRREAGWGTLETFDLKTH